MKQPAQKPSPRTSQKLAEKPVWVNALEESLLLAIGLFTLITWFVVVGVLAH